VKREGDTFYYDLELLGEDGSVLEQWEGLCLRKVADIQRRRAWPVSLLGPYLERWLEEHVPGANVSLALGREETSNDVIERALGRPVTLRYRADGKPEISEGHNVSAAHAGELTLAVTAPGPVGCDLEAVTFRDMDVWRSLLGAERFRLAEALAANEDFDTAATRAWCAIECLKKAGAMGAAPLVVNAANKDGWTVLSSGARIIATYCAEVRDVPGRLVLGVLVPQR
jgi:enediyne polyketide synthase